MNLLNLILVAATMVLRISSALSHWGARMTKLKRFVFGATNILTVSAAAIAALVLAPVAGFARLRATVTDWSFMSGRSLVLLKSVLVGILITSHSSFALSMSSDIGTECGSCQFPTAVRLSSRCTGVYMGDGLILTAAHCLNGIDEGSSVQFGESLINGANAELSGEVDYCVRHPDGHSSDTVFGEDDYDGVDLGFCILKDDSPFHNLPIVPPMVPVGCERDWLSHEVYETASAIVTAVGAGCEGHNSEISSCGISGIKRFTAQELVGQVLYGGSYTKLQMERFGSDDSSIRSGDSGGPIFDVMPDGTWRLIGVIHGTSIFDRSYAEAVPPYLHWIESESGIDITPCHNYANGDWVLNLACEGSLPLDTNEAGASWSSSCPTASGGGVWGPFDGLCAGWPIEFDDLVVSDSLPAGLSPQKFAAALQSLTHLPVERRDSASRALVQRADSMKVFPYLARNMSLREVDGSSFTNISPFIPFYLLGERKTYIYLDGQEFDPHHLVFPDKSRLRQKAVNDP